MTNSKWLRSALLGGVAVSVMATGAQASELTDLKAQLEALQSRVNTIETAPAQVPAGAMLMTVAKGQGSNAAWGNESAKDAANVNAARGFTVAINPTADLPAPVTEITVYGYAKLDLSWSNETAYLHSHDMSSAHGANENNRWYAHAQQSRFGIKAKTDTAIGQIRSKIEGDFYGSPYATTTNFRLRHAYGEWDMTPNWTLVAGQTWHTASLLPIGISTIDFSSDAGPTYSRSAQLSLAYKNGPITGLIGISSPQFGAADFPDVGGRLQYSASGGHEFIVSGSLGDEGPGVTGYSVGAGANIRLGDMATITTGGHYGRGRAVRRYLNQEGFANTNVAGNATRAWGAAVGVSMSVSEATTVNAQFGYTDQLQGAANHRNATTGFLCSATAFRNASCVDDVMTIHANVLWRPVKQMRLGWEVSWGRNDYYGAIRSNSEVQARFGAWFFF